MKTKLISLSLSMLLITSGITGCSQSYMNDTATLTSTASGIMQPNTSNSSNTTRDSNVSASEMSDVLIDTEILSPSTNISSNDTNTSWDESATKIALSGSSASVTGSGAAVSGSVVTITHEGTYVMSGTLTDGQIVIAATNKEKVHLILNGVDITNKTGAPIYASQCDKLTVTLAERTQNTLTDGAAGIQYADTANEEPNAALFCKDDLTINGTGSLTVNAGFNNGIATKDDLLIVSGNITVNAANHGLRGNDSVTVIDGNIKITSGNDGIQTNNTEDVSLGWVLVEGGVFNITAAHDGIQADTTVLISGGQFDISTGSAASSESTSDSYKGIKSNGNISITGGSFIIESADDAIHANGNIAINGGEFTISTGDDGVHADGDLLITGSSTSIEILTSYEGLEAKSMTIADGIITLYTTDDGINIAGGNDTNGAGRFGGDKFSVPNNEQWLKITGGTITVTAGSDGIDINGSGEMTGGDVSITAATLGEGETIDSDGSFTKTGGNLTESGGNSMGGRGGGMKGQKPPRQ